MAKILAFLLKVAIILNFSGLRMAMSKPIANTLMLTADNEDSAPAKLEGNAIIRDRMIRQVVQPTWLNQPNLFAAPVDPNVYVTAQNLKEAAELRKEIQQAVQEGRYAVPGYDAAGSIPVLPVQQQQFAFQPIQWNYQYPAQVPNWNMQTPSFTWQQLQVQAQQYMAALQQRWLEMFSKANATAGTT